MPGPQSAFRRAATLLPAVLLVNACAGFGLFESQSEPQPLPATVPEIRAAIEIERSRLLDLVSETTEDEERWNDNTDAMVYVAERISRLQAALDELEPAGEASSTSPTNEVPAP